MHLLSFFIHIYIYMATTADFKNGLYISFNGKPCSIIWFQHVKPGKVADPTCKDPQTEGLRAYNKLVFEDQEVSSVLLPLGDGLSICRKDGLASDNPTR